MGFKDVSVRPATGPSVILDTAAWEFRFPKHDLRFVRLMCHEYIGESLAIGNVEVGGEQASELYIPTKEDVLALAANDTLEIAGGDNVIAHYTDEVTLNDQAGSQLLVSKLQATYFNAATRAIAYEFEKANNGSVYTVRKELKRVDPGERIVVEIIDYDEDRTDQRDTIPFQAVLNDGEVMKLIATETEPNTGIFTKEIDTSVKPEQDKLQVKSGDQITLPLYRHSQYVPRSFRAEGRDGVRHPAHVGCRASFGNSGRAASEGHEGTVASRRLAEERKNRRLSAASRLKPPSPWK